MVWASFRFYAELNDFLPVGRRQKAIDYNFGECQSVKHLLEAMGVPHPEVDLILVNGEPAGFEYLVCNQDRVSVFPRFRCIEVGSISKVQPPALDETRFVLDGHLGRLAAYLRMVGFDTLYRNDYQDGELARISSSERRILLTRDRGLLKRSLVAYGYWMRETNPRKQLAEVLGRFDLWDQLAPFERCLLCNGLFQEVDKSAVEDLLMPATRRFYDEFRRCQDCGRVYWSGSHVQRMQKLIDSLLAEHQRGSDPADEA